MRHHAWWQRGWISRSLQQEQSKSIGMGLLLHSAGSTVTATYHNSSRQAAPPAPIPNCRLQSRNAPTAQPPPHAHLKQHQEGKQRVGRHVPAGGDRARHHHCAQCWQQQEANGHHGQHGLPAQGAGAPPGALHTAGRVGGMGRCYEGCLQSAERGPTGSQLTGGRAMNCSAMPGVRAAKNAACLLPACTRIISTTTQEQNRPTCHAAPQAAHRCTSHARPTHF